MTLFIVILQTTACSVELADTDHDGVADKIDRCLNTAQVNLVNPDFKYSSTLDPRRLEDKPQAWPVDEHGCELDSDNDGVIDSKDYCPDNTTLEISSGVASNGCPLQSDADGTPDYRDRCPETPSDIATDQYGCPK
ncbi:MAG: thrombospondin type 3 repeat-containing protein [Gammaproteobacteria bacterium]|nr:thrombospondin type 3 repeat-containing protein [Gammaproteobacteria bacterium]